MANDFYVYQYARDGIPFYIGKGRGLRAYDHWKTALKGQFSSKNRLFAAALRSLIAEGLEPEITFISKNLSADQALDQEEDLIRQLGRKIDDTGPLCNILARGSKQPTRDKSVKIRLSEKHRESISKGLSLAYQLGRKKPAAYRQLLPEAEAARVEKIKKALTGRKMAPLKADHKKQISMALSGRKKSKEHVERVSRALAGKPQVRKSWQTYTIKAHHNDKLIIEEETTVKLFTKKHNINASSFYRTLQRGTPIAFGKSAGWQLLELSDCTQTLNNPYSNKE
jgi:hypothetical protein